MAGQDEWRQWREARIERLRRPHGTLALIGTHWLEPVDAEGRTVADFNRAYLPPCAFVDHYVCPVPPAGNTLPFAIEAGEQSVQTR